MSKGDVGAYARMRARRIAGHGLQAAGALQDGNLSITGEGEGITVRLSATVDNRGQVNGALRVTLGLPTPTDGESHARPTTVRDTESVEQLSDEHGNAAPHTVRRVRSDCSQLFMAYQGRHNNLMMRSLQFIRTTKIHDRNILMFRDTRGSDYRRGIADEIPTIWDCLRWQEEQRALHFPHVRNTYCLGPSSGGRAAIFFGYFLQARVVWAFAPPSTQMLPPYLRFPHDELSERCADLRWLLAESNGVTEYRIFYNESYQEDREAAEALGHCPGVRLFPQAGEGHGVVFTMADSGALSGLIDPFEAA
jgi:hypothetical protein